MIRALGLCGCIGWLAIAPPPVGAQETDTWEYAPYRVQVWLAVRPAAELPVAFEQKILARLRTELPLYAGATWRLEVGRAPRAFSSTLVALLDRVSVQQIAEASEEVLEQDKLMLLTVEPVRGHYQISCRELDCHARSLSLVSRTRVLQRERIPRDCARAVARVFAPRIRVESSRGRDATARIRAGGLVRHDHCVSRVQQGSMILSGSFILKSTM